jgi:hypothetical protein
MDRLSYGAVVTARILISVVFILNGMGIIDQTIPAKELMERGAAISLVPLTMLVGRVKFGDEDPRVIDDTIDRAKSFYCRRGNLAGGRKFADVAWHTTSLSVATKVDAVMFSALLTTL